MALGDVVGEEHHRQLLIARKRLPAVGRGFQTPSTIRKSRTAPPFNAVNAS